MLPMKPAIAIQHADTRADSGATETNKWVVRDLGDWGVS